MSSQGLKPTDTTELLSDLGGGAFLKALDITLSEIGAAVIENRKGGSVTVEIKIKPQGSGMNVVCNHKMSCVIPTENGKKTEDLELLTPLVVNEKGNITMYPENQLQMFEKDSKTKDGPINRF
tara:strand:+ start:2973 stop:3341 length:369 start_codon:yes stop_codon:yes gene_type:complete